MKKIILGISLTALLSISANAQIDSAQVEKRLDQIEQQFQQLNKSYETTQNQLQQLNSKDNSLQRSINRLSARGEGLSAQIDSLNNQLKENRTAVSNLNQQLTEQKEELNGQISQTRKTTDQSVSELNKALTKNTLYWIIAVLVVGILSILAFVLLRKKVTDNQSSINESLASTRRELEKEAIRLDEKLVGVMETQMKIIQEERKAQPERSKGEQDHSLALKVADEIERIEKNLERVEDQKRIKPLAKALERIRANFQANGYEIVSLLNQKYDDRMSLDVINFKVDDTLKDSERIISRVVKPQVKYNGVLIQRGQVDVSQSE